MMQGANAMQFMQHMSEHGLSYGTIEEFNFRKGLFDQTEQGLQALRADPLMTHEVEHNMFSTMTDAEKAQMRGYMPMS